MIPQTPKPSARPFWNRAAFLLTFCIFDILVAEDSTPTTADMVITSYNARFTLFGLRNQHNTTTAHLVK
jgi:hypothetical protein